MNQPSIASPEALLSHTYHPWKPFPQMLHALLHLALPLTHSTQACLCLCTPELLATEDPPHPQTPATNPDKTLTIHRRHPACHPCHHFHNAPHQRPRPALAGPTAPACPHLTETAGSRLALPLTYQHTLLGTLALAAPHPHHYSPPRLHQAQWLARHLTYLIKRQQLHQLARRLLNRNLHLIGISPALHQVERFVEKAAPTPLPVLILGEPGTETTTVATMLHLAGPHPDAPFIEVNGATLAIEPPTTHLANLFRQAQGGTLFIQDIEALPLPQQIRLIHLLPTGQLTRPPTPHPPTPARLLAATHHNPHDLVASGHLLPLLRETLDVLRLHLPPLRHRPEDLRPLVHTFLHQYGHPTPPRLSHDVWALFQTYPWPGNVAQLERIIARLTALTTGPLITLADVQAYAPELLPSSPPSPLPSSMESHSADRPPATLPTLAPPQPAPPPPDQLIAALASGETSGLGSLHPALQKALTYMAQHFPQPLTLSQVASQACISRSRLCHLFHQTWGLSFTAVLARLRITHAQRLLLAEPALTVTQIAHRVGFGDLRHFERMFKRLTGSSPRAYRHAHRRTARAGHQ